jgi:lysylphosphatidylglycerol synthetase-like protein (DUF2156 family)
MKTVSRVATMGIGLVGAVIGFVVNALYSLLHLLGRISGITSDRSHFFIGTGLSILAAIGAILVVSSPEAGALVLVLATIGFFFIVGWWAIIPAVFLIGAAVLAIMNREEYRRPPTGAPQV